MLKTKSTSPNIEFTLVQIAAFLAILAVGSILLYSTLKVAFMANPYLNASIFALMLLGIIHLLYRLLSLKPELVWLQHFPRKQPTTTESPLKLLTPVTKLLTDNTKQLNLHTVSTLIDSVSARLSDTDALTRFITRALIFLGLLGTFWGLILTIGSVGKVIASLEVQSADPAVILSQIKTSLSAPLTGMAKGFSSSLFGLSGALIIGFIDLNVTKAQSKFLNHTEEWLLAKTKLSTLSGDSATSPVFVHSLLEHTAERIEDLALIIKKNEDSHHIVANNISNLSERLSLLTDQMRTEQNIMIKQAESLVILQETLVKFSKFIENISLDHEQVTKAHIRNIDTNLTHLSQSLQDGNTKSMEALQSEIRLLTRTIANATVEGAA